MDASGSEGARGLTSYTKFSGCGAKLGPGTLARALCGLSQPSYPGLLADFSGNEDAGVFRLGGGRALVGEQARGGDRTLEGDQALVQTVDFFPPIVDDPFLFGRIAAANALSDIYAMGGQPLTALAIVCFPVKELGIEVLGRMMEGGLEALIEAGCALVGGHSIEDPEPKLGYSVTGLVDPGAIWRNNSIRPGLALLLTKPIGTGLVNMAQRAGMASEASIKAAESSMARLNKGAAEILGRHGVKACTDVTGFGLAGHAAEMAEGGTCGLRLFASSVPTLPGALEYAENGLVPEGTWRNKEGRMKAMGGQEALEPALLDLLFDPQTSGGLLAALPAAKATAALAELRAAGIEAALVGECGGPAGRVELGP